MNVVPRRLALLTFEGFLGIVARLEDGPIRPFDNDARRRKGRSPVLPAKIDREPFCLRFRSEDDVPESVALFIDFTSLQR
jgi:hypothetical protein